MRNDRSLARRRWFILVFSLTLVLFPGGCAPKADPAANQGTISISGAFALYPLMQRWTEEFQKANPGVTFDISAGGAGKGMADTLAGAVDIGMISRDITPAEETKGAYGVAVAKDAVLPVANAQNPLLQDLLTQGVKRESFAKLFLSGETMTWGQVVNRSDIHDPVHVYTRSDACGAGETWALYLGKSMKQDNLKGIGISGDPGVLDAVAKDKLGIGYNNLNYAYDMTTGKPITNIVVIPVDYNENGRADPDEILDSKVKAVAMVANGKYPSPPARLLFLATKGKPQGLVQKFLVWVLTDGQKYVSETGYVQITQEQLDLALQKTR